MAFPDRRTANVLLTILLFAVLLAITYAARHIFLLFFLAILFAYLLDPVVRFLQHHSLLFRNLRGPAVVEVYLAFLIATALAAYGVAPGLLKQAGKLLDAAPALLDSLSNGEIATQMRDNYGWSDAQERRLKAFLAGHREDVQSLVRIGEQYTSHAAQAIGWLVLIPLLAIFFLLDGPYVAQVIVHLASAGGKYRVVQEVADEINVTFRRYIRAKAILGGLSFIFYSAAMLLLNFPYPFALGFLGGVLEFIPAAGWMISAAAIVGVGILTHSSWIWMAVLLGIWRVVQDYYSSPRVMGHELEIHPLMTIFAVLVGWRVGGILGIYLLVPTVAAIRAIWRRYGLSRAQPQSVPELVHTTVNDGYSPAGLQSLGSNRSQTDTAAP